MNSMTKKLPLVISFTSALALALLVIYQSGVISELTEVLTISKKKLALTEQALQQEMETSESLRREIAVLTDSIEELNLEVATLQDKIAEQKSIIRNLNASLRKMEDRVGQLTKEIQRLEGKNAGNEQRINALVKERDDLLVKMEEKDRLRIAAMNDQKQKEQQQAAQSNRLLELESKMEQKQERLDTKVEEKQNITPSFRAQTPDPVINQSPASPDHVAAPSANEEMSRIIKNRQQERMNNILTQTSVRFSGVTLRNRESSNDLKKIRENGNGWRYTFIDFDLENPDKGAIMDETFIVQIYDLDNKLVVPMNEKNPNFPESEQGAIGYKFKYDGKPVSVRYYNTQKKEGENFEIRLVYFKNGLTFNLANGRKKIVENGLVIVP
jgi:hypothetical protein